MLLDRNWRTRVAWEAKTRAARATIFYSFFSGLSFHTASTHCGHWDAWLTTEAMRHSSLASFLLGELPPDELWREIEPEVTACLAACAKGGSGHVIITEGPDTLVSRGQMSVLLAALAEAKLPLEAGAYIADALIMSKGFEWEDDAVAEALFFLSDESRPLTLVDIEKVRSRLVTGS